MTAQIAKETLFLHNAEMGLGAWAWGDRVVWHYGQGYTDDDIQAALQTALEAGINLVDTAEVYGSGRSERLLGQFIKNSAKPVLVATKFMPYPWRLTRGAMSKALQRSLERLELEHIDLYQIHWPLPPFPIEYWVEGLAEMVKARLTHAVGVSNYDKNQMQRAYTVLAKYDIPLASNQVEYHLLDRSIEKNGLLDRCHELGVRLIAYSPLAKALLTGKYTADNPPPGIRGRGAAGILSRLGSLLQLMTEIGQDHGNKTPGQVALNWVICKGALPIPGAKTASQAAQNAAALGWRLTAEQVLALDQASDKISK
ncbi:MAG: aldo/keto reductase [Chloroflexi bacterium]|nr:aldo/keto reductase [Chloroflexota bacterium]